MWKYAITMTWVQSATGYGMTLMPELPVCRQLGFSFTGMAQQPYLIHALCSTEGNNAFIRTCDSDLLNGMALAPVSEPLEF